MNYRSLFSLFCVLFLLNTQLGAQTTSDAYTRYIEQYKSLAIEQMQRHRIPASITLAQGLLESAAGQSRLARVGNNHFGIKATSDWYGPVILADDDSRNEKFRKYRSAAESYEDHSLFLQRPRYNELYQLSPTDYKKWARTLRKCGYATNPHYANHLIEIIERYDLAQYDQQGGTTKKKKHEKQKASASGRSTQEVSQEFLLAHNLGRVNDSYYIIAKQGDNLQIIADSVGKEVSKLRSYNHIPKGCDVYPGQIIYLTKKADSNPGMRGMPHVVQPGESLYDIAQRYGVRLKALYDMNNLKKNYQARVGDRIVLCR